MSILLEVCIDSIESARAAQAGGADRLEVCSCLSNGGTTPCYGLLKQCLAVLQLPVMMMIRPHDGAFIYSEDDIETMVADIDLAHSLGVQGVVFGALSEDRKVHVEHCTRLLSAAGSLETTFHRAFDLVADPIQSFDEIVQLGFNRLLTSGQAAHASEGVPLICQLVERGGDRISVIAGSGINADNARQIADATGVQELHGSASVLKNPDSHGGDVAFGTAHCITSAQQVQLIKKALT